MVAAPASTAKNTPKEEGAGTLEMNIFVTSLLSVLSLDHGLFVIKSVCDGAGRRRSTTVNKVTARSDCARLEKFEIHVRLTDQGDILSDENISPVR